MTILTVFTVFLTIGLWLLFYIERRTMWIGVLFIVWLLTLFSDIILTIEMYENHVAFVIALVVVGFTVLGFPFYLLSFILLLFTSGIELIKKEGRKIRNLLSLLFGIFVIGWLVVSPFLIPKDTSPIMQFIIHCLTFSVYYFYLLMMIFAVSSLLNRIPFPRRKYDYIIVLGSGLIKDQVPPLLASRIDKALACYRRNMSFNPSTKVIFTGGQGSDETVPEGVAMAQYAKSKGLSENAMIIEDQATDTYENLLFSKQLIAKDRIANARKTDYHVLTVTNNFHVFRALLWARKVKLHTDGIGSKTKFYFWLNALIREFIGVLYMQRKYHITFLLLVYAGILGLVLINQFYVVPFRQ